MELSDNSIQRIGNLIDKKLKSNNSSLATKKDLEKLRKDLREDRIQDLTEMLQNKRLARLEEDVDEIFQKLEKVVSKIGGLID